MSNKLTVIRQIPKKDRAAAFENRTSCFCCAHYLFVDVSGGKCHNGSITDDGTHICDEFEKGKEWER